MSYIGGAGALPSPRDDRDWRISRIMELPKASGGGKSIYPKEYSVPYIPKVKDQGRVNSCTAFALAGIFECVRQKLCGEADEFSTGYLYGNRIESDYKGMGEIMRDAVKCASKHGDVRAALWDNNFEVPEALEAFEKVHDVLHEYAHRLITGYVRLYSPEEAKAHLLKYGIPLFVNTRIKNINPMSKSTALHAMMCTGWLKNGDFKCLNSWGAYDCPKPETDYYEFEEVWGIIPMSEKEFTDVTEDRWSAQAIKTAAADGIIEGFPDGTFSPEGEVTREQMAVIWERMKRYCEENFEKNL